MIFNKKGITGIDVLIIFISVVIIASLAATVLINVNLNLSQQAEKTGKKVQDKFSSAFEILSINGNYEDGYDYLVLTIKPVILDKDMNVEDITLQIKTKDDIYIAKYEKITNCNSEGIKDIKNKGYSFCISGDKDKIKEGEVYVIYYSFPKKINAGEEIEVTIIPKNGIKRSVNITLPESGEKGLINIYSG